MAKYNKAIVDRICSLIRGDSYTIAEICKNVGISEGLFYKWKAEKVEFFDAIKKAQEDFNEFLQVEAKKSLVKMLQGYTVTETKTVTVDTGEKTETGKPKIKIKEHTKTEKHIQPNPTLIIFTLTNRDPENWKNRQSTDITSGGEKLFEAPLTPEKRKEILEQWAVK